MPPLVAVAISSMFASRGGFAARSITSQGIPASRSREGSRASPEVAVCGKRPERIAPTQARRCGQAVYARSNTAESAFSASMVDGFHSSAIATITRAGLDSAPTPVAIASAACTNARRLRSMVSGYHDHVRHAVLLLAIAAPLVWPADIAVIENTGKPIAIPFQCDAQQLDEAGLSCTPDDPCKVFLELSGIETVGAKIFLTGNLHTPTTTLSSVFLESADNGRTWTEPYDRMPLTALEGVQFIDFERGWAAGETVQGVPRNPFFLVTTDGGRTWRRQPVFEDDEPG